MYLMRDYLFSFRIAFALQKNSPYKAKYAKKTIVIWSLVLDYK